jgi:hypothetical protein
LCQIVTLLKYKSHFMIQKFFNVYFYAFLNQTIESPETSYAPLLSIPPKLTSSLLIFPQRPPTRIIDTLSSLVSSCPVERQVDILVEEGSQ